MLKLILLVPAAALLLLAGEGIYHAARGRHPVAIACDQFRREPPSPRVLVSGCEINYAGAGYRESGGQVEELFLPSRPAGGPSVPAPIVVATRDPAAIALARSVLGGGRTPTTEQSLETMRGVVAQLQMSNAIDGLVRTGFIERLRSQRILSGLAKPIAADAVIVDLHGTPDFVRPGLALASGALLALIALWPLRRVQPAVAVVVPPLPPPALASDIELSQYDADLAFYGLAEQREVATLQPDVSPTSIPASLPRLLLLALDASSGPEAIEAAPPLGSRAEVIAILRGVISDLAVDSARVVLARPDGSVRVDLGPNDPVPTAVIEARGEAGAALVKEVLIMTGWRAFAPKTGLFLSVDDLEALAALAAEGPVV
jgi:hypothetical protein